MGHAIHANARPAGTGMRAMQERTTLRYNRS